MNKQELQQAIDFLFEPEAILGLELYFVLNGPNGVTLRLADLGDGELPTEVLNGFLNVICSLKQKLGYLILCKNLLYSIDSK